MISSRINIRSIRYKFNLEIKKYSSDSRPFQFSKDVTKIGWIGTGVMGKHMCSHLMNHGYQMSVYTRTKEKSTDLLNKGATWCSSPIELAQNSDVVFSIVGFVKDVDDVLIGEKGAIHGLKKGGILVDMTTSSPALAKKIDSISKEKGCYSIDAPVSGGDIGARNANLSIMVGGNKTVYDALIPLFETMGKNIKYMGESGSGQNTKMVNQILISTTMIGVVEGLLYGYKAGLNLEDIISVVEKGAAGSWSISNYGPRIVNLNYDPGFFVEHFIKDLNIAMEEAKRMNLNLPGLQLSLRLYDELKKLGHGKKGTHSLMLALAKMNDIDFKPEKSGE